MQHSEGGVCEIVAPYAGMITTLGKEQLRVAKTLLTASGAMYDSVYIPGGPDSVRSLMLADEAYRFVEDMYRQGKPICASNEGVDFLANTRVAKNVKLTDSHLLEDKGVVTTRHVMQDRSAFLDACVNAGKRCRFWDVRKGDTMF
jgi:catalase